MKKNYSKNNFKRKLFLSALVVFVGFGYFLTLIYGTIYILNDPEIDNAFVISIWIAYFLFFSVPAKLAWSGFYHLFGYKPKLIGKLILLFAFYVFWPAYFLFSFLEIWYFTPKVLLKREVKRRLEKEKKEHALPIRKKFDDDNVFFWTRDEWVPYSVIKRLIGGFHYFSAIKITDLKSDHSLIFKTPGSLNSIAFPLYKDSDLSKSFVNIFEKETKILNDEFPFYPYEPFIEYFFQNLSFTWEKELEKDIVVEITYFKESFIYQLK